jgi:CBS domain-containing protein
MSDRHFGAVLVTEKHGRLIGIFTGRDAVCRVLAAGKSPVKTRLGDVMTASPVTMSPDRTVIEALRLMWDGGFRHVPVVIDDDKLVGVVSRGDFKGLEQSRLEEERDLWERL